MPLYNLYIENIGKHRRRKAINAYVRLCSPVAGFRGAVEDIDDSLDGLRKIHLPGRCYRSIGLQGLRILHAQVEERSIWGEWARRWARLCSNCAQNGRFSRPKVGV